MGKRRIWFSADQHFGHANIIRFCQRPFSSSGEMDQAMIQRWNCEVAPEDTVYCLGDFRLGVYAQQYFTRLNGHIHIVPGGHDRRWLKDGPVYSATNRLVDVLPPLFTLYVPVPGASKTQRIVLCHYPLESWEGSNHGSWHLHGHSHGRLPSKPGRLDVGVDSHGFYPLSLEEVCGELTQ